MSPKSSIFLLIVLVFAAVIGSLATSLTVCGFIYWGTNWEFDCPTAVAVIYDLLVIVLIVICVRQKKERSNG